VVSQMRCNAFMAALMFCKCVAKPSSRKITLHSRTGNTYSCGLLVRVRPCMSRICALDN
jgi:hypothetical protein